MSDDFGQVIHSTIWQEEAEPYNPFTAQTCYCSGYDVYGDLLGKASYLEYLFLLFKGERPEKSSLAALEILAVALANPGPRDPSVHAAMAAGTSGSTAAATLMAALAVGAGSYGGAREVFLSMQAWEERGLDLAVWCASLQSPKPPSRMQIWPEIEHPAGFDPYSVQCASPVLQTLKKLAEILPSGCVSWLARERAALETAAAHPIAMSGVAAATLIDLHFNANEGEMLSLLLRLPGAAVHALEQKKQGFRQFPFFAVNLDNDPGIPSQKGQI